MEPDIGTPDLTAWGPAAKHTSPCQKLSIYGLQADEDVRAEQIEAVVKAFWEVVNINDDETSSQPLCGPKLTESTDNNTSNDTNSGTSINTSSTTIQYGFTEGPSDPCLSPPFETYCRKDAPTLPPKIERRATNHTQAKYDVFRDRLALLKPKIPKVYYEQWLVECRLEIREMVGSEGALVRDPPREMSAS